MLLYGTGDRTLAWRCSQNLYEAYGKKGQRILEVFEGDDHALTGHPQEAEELLCGFIAKCVDVDISGFEQVDVIQQRLMETRDRVDMMKEGEDLKEEQVG